MRASRAVNPGGAWARFGKRLNGEERAMSTTLRCLRLDLVGKALSLLLLLGTWPAPADSGPRLLWQTQPQHG